MHKKNENFCFSFDNKLLPIKIIRHARAKKIKLRVITLENCIKVTVPHMCPMWQVKEFIHSHESWIRKRLAAGSRYLVRKDFNSLPILGLMRNIVPDKNISEGVELDGLYLKYSGPTKSSRCQIKSFLLKFANKVFSSWCDYYSSALEVSYNRLVLKDPKTRWGSCSQNKNLMLNWRLILAPEFVGRYVVCHEVSHLIHMNHRKQFWTTVKTIFPNYQYAQNWLKNNGMSLYIYNFED